MKNRTDPRPGRRPRVVPASGPAVDVGEADGRPISVGFQDEPGDLPPGVAARGVLRDPDVRAPAVASRAAEPVPAKFTRP